MLKIFRTSRRLLKVHVISIDTGFFILHHQITVIILLALSMLVTSQQFFKHPMECNFSDLLHTGPHSQSFELGTIL